MNSESELIPSSTWIYWRNFPTRNGLGMDLESDLIPSLTRIDYLLEKLPNSEWARNGLRVRSHSEFNSDLLEKLPSSEWTRNGLGFHSDSEYTWTLLRMGSDSTRIPRNELGFYSVRGVSVNCCEICDL
jgi:hypothetical protein